jgi:TolB protein
LVRLVVPNGRQPAIRTDGRIVYNGVGGGKDNLNGVNLDVSEFTSMSNHTEDAYPSWSPDGAFVVFYASATAGGNQLFTLPAGARNQEPASMQYNGSGLLGQFPTWLSNRRVAYSGCGYQWGSGGLCGIWSLNSDGTDPQRVTDTGDDRPTDSGAGRLLFTRQAGGNTDVYVTSDTGGPAVNLTNNPNQDFGASFAPDGRSIAFMSNRDGWGIWVMNADGSDQRKLASVSGGFGTQWQDERLSWGP